MARDYRGVSAVIVSAVVLAQAIALSATPSPLAMQMPDHTLGVQPSLNSAASHSGSELTSPSGVNGTPAKRSMAVRADEPGSPPHPNAIPVRGPPSFSGHYYAGSEYYGPGGSTRHLQVDLQIPNATADTASFYYVLLSAWDSAGSYDQLGFSDDYGVWGLTYSTTSYCAATYYYDPDVQTLQQGQIYVFDMSVTLGNVSLSASYGSNATLVWSYTVETGGTSFDEQPYTCNDTVYASYTDYEEVYETSGALIPYDFFFTNNSAGGSLVHFWIVYLNSAPTEVNVYLSASNVTIENVPTELVLSPSSGIVGSTIAASGAGFAGNAAVTFTFGGVTVTSPCWTNATGNFPGTLPGACSLTVPAIPGGTEVVTASDGRIIVTTSFAVRESLSVSPDSGPVGSRVTGVGSGFAANSPINFTVAGRAMTSVCTTDSNGSFPGSSGTPCTFAAPAVPRGNTTIVASSPTWTTLIGINVEDNPQGVAYDMGRGEVFVANSDSNTVSVISDETNTVVATVGVGSDPFDLAYDPDQGEVFVTNLNSGTVSVISDTTNTVVATIVLGGFPTYLTGLAYDSATKELFVANSGADNLSVISCSTDKVVASVGLGASPYSMVYDAGTGEVFVVDFGSTYAGNVSVVSGATNKVVAAIVVGAGASDIAYDSAQGELFVPDAGTDSLSVISDKTDTVVAKVTLGSSNANGPNGVAYDPASGELFVTNSGSNNVSVVSDATDRLVCASVVGYYPTGVAYDSGLREVFVAIGGEYGASVSVLVPSTASTLFGVLPSVGLPSSPDGVDVGQTVTVQMNGFGSTQPITVFTLGHNPLYCASATSGTCAAGALTTDSSGSVVATFFVSSAVAPGSYLLTVVDAAGNRATMNTTVNIDPTVATPTVSPRASVDLGQSATFTTRASSGSGNFSYVWLGLPGGCSGDQSSVNCTPTTAGSFWVSINAVDSSGFVASSGVLPFVVYPALNVSALTSSMGSADVGQVVTFAVTTSGGSGEITSYSWSGMPPGCTNSNTASLSCTPTSPGTLPISVNVTDSNGFTAVSETLSFTVFTDLVVSSFSVSPTSATTGSSTTFLAVTTGGEAPLTYAYPGLPPGCLSTNASTFTCTPTVTGTFTVEMIIHDVNGFEATRNVTLTVGARVLGLPATEGYALMGGIAALVIVGAVVVVIQRRRHEAPLGPATSPAHAADDAPPVSR